VGLCYDYVAGLPELGRSNLGELLNSKDSKSGDENELEMIFPMKKAVDMVSRGVPHRLQKDVKRYLETIDKIQNEHKDLPEQALKRMEESLQQKINLSKELNDFEMKQSWLFIGVFVIITVWIVVFLICYKKKQMGEKSESKEAPELPEDKHVNRQLLKLDKMLKLMEAEEIRMRQELEELRAENQAK
jgi:hypothetical protein